MAGCGDVIGLHLDEHADLSLGPLKGGDEREGRRECRRPQERPIVPFAEMGVFMGQDRSELAAGEESLGGRGLHDQAAAPG